CSIMYGKGFAFYFSIRFAKNMIQLPINIILTYYVLGFVKYIDKKIYN
ncbi:MAG TPA: folate family ECF transporter S component, partial [Eubacterium sp.]|nr:folate family ECF transporter S component [Eubacterium sp.]